MSWFYERPIASFFLIAAIVSLLLGLFLIWKAKREPEKLPELATCGQERCKVAARSKPQGE